MVPDVLKLALRSRNLRATPQRRSVLDAVEDLGHATAEQVCAHVQRTDAEISLATVYRTLELLEELQMVTHTHLEHGSPTYHSVTSGDHLHLVCRGCGVVGEADASHGHALAAAVERHSGFRTDVRHLALHGLCADCRRREAIPPGSALEDT